MCSFAVHRHVPTLASNGKRDLEIFTVIHPCHPALSDISWYTEFGIQVRSIDCRTRGLDGDPRRLYHTALSTSTTPVLLEATAAAILLTLVDAGIQELVEMCEHQPYLWRDVNFLVVSRAYPKRRSLYKGCIYIRRHNQQHLCHPIRLRSRPFRCWRCTLHL